MSNIISPKQPTTDNNNKNNNNKNNNCFASSSSSNSNNNSNSSGDNMIGIGEFYAGKTVFITGGTGFMGKVLLEKLLRSCSGVKQIFLLIRTKKGQDAEERLKHLLDSPLFNEIRKLNPLLLEKVAPIQGDITQPDLSISVDDRATLARTVNIVFHSAATVKFDEKLKLSVTINVLGTQRLVELCNHMIHLEALVHVSTAYCNCDRTEITETVLHQSSLSKKRHQQQQQSFNLTNTNSNDNGNVGGSLEPHQVTQLVELLDEPLLDSLTPQLIGARPNTYTFTKALAECWLQENKGDLPVVIVRPSIVLSIANGPKTGWVDNWNGPTGIIAAAGKGLFRTMFCDPNCVADLIPVDMVINLMLVSAWRIATNKSKQLVVYNCSTGQRKPITWKRFITLCFKYMRKNPFSQVVWYPDGTITACRTLNTLNQYLFQWLPAYFIDSFVWITGGKPMMLRIQDKLSKAATCLEYFTTNEWRFDDTNVHALHRYVCTKASDHCHFQFDVAQIDWDSYIEAYVRGIRRYLFKEDELTLESARKHMVTLYWRWRTLQTLAGVLCTWYFIFARATPSIRALWSRTLHLLVHIARMLPSVV